MADTTREGIIHAAQEAAQRTSGPLSRADFERLTGISQYHIYRAFPDGGWSEVKRLAGLDRHPKDMRALTDEQLLEAFHQVATQLGRIPTWAVFATKAAISADTVRRRFRGSQGTLTRYRQWLEKHYPDSPLLEQVRTESQDDIPSPPHLDVAQPGAMFTWDKADATQFGRPIDFRGLRHAPVNEQGVVFLFGTIAYELGFIVEAIHSSFPDCEAKRCIDQRRDRWQRVLIEFEYESRNFKDHGHDPSACDLIVCWEHNWPECPIQVLELRKVIDELEV